MDTCQGWGIIIMACLSQLDQCHILVKCLASVQLLVGQISVGEELGGQRCVTRCIVPGVTSAKSIAQIIQTQSWQNREDNRGGQWGVGMSMIMPTSLSLLLKTKHLTGQRESWPTNTKPVIKGTRSRCLFFFFFYFILMTSNVLKYDALLVPWPVTSKQLHFKRWNKDLLVDRKWKSRPKNPS